jgi:hypothetical protein
MVDLIQIVEGLTHRNWADRYKSALPGLWRERMNVFPSEPFMREIGGRTPQHFEALARADSFLTDGELATTIASVQRMFPAVFGHRLMYGLGEGGLDVLDKVYGADEILRFLQDSLLWALSLGVAPKGKFHD